MLLWRSAGDLLRWLLFSAPGKQLWFADSCQSLNVGRCTDFYEVVPSKTTIKTSLLDEVTIFWICYSIGLSILNYNKYKQYFYILIFKNGIFSARHISVLKISILYYFINFLRKLYFFIFNKIYKLLIGDRLTKKIIMAFYPNSNE